MKHIQQNPFVFKNNNNNNKKYIDLNSHKRKY